MRKRILFSIMGISIFGVLLLTVALIFLFYNPAEDNRVVTYIGIAITMVIAIIAAIAVTASYASRKLTGNILEALEKIGLNEENIATYDELMQFAINIEEKRRAYNARIEELSNRTATIETITDSMQEGLMLIDGNGSILSANNSAHQVFGLNIEKRSVMHVCRDGEFQNAFKKCVEGKNVEMKMERDDKIFTVFFSPVLTRGKTRGAVILFHDATESLRAEQQRREFSANVSHELKTPLTTISALSEMIAQGMAREEDVKGFADRITEQSGRLLVLIDDIIRLSEFDEGKANREAVEFDLWELAETVINALRDNAGGVDIQLNGERFDISANHRMIDELLYNLIDNGVKYNKENGNVMVELTQVENGVCKIAVSDTGIGISNEHHAHVFERFYRAEKSRSKKTGGTGLGLSIVKHIAEYYNGYVELKSEEGVGTTVTCCLRY